MTGKIKFIEPRGEYTNASGTFNKYQVAFDDGKTFQFLARGEFKKQVGDLVDYTITNEEYKTAKLVYILNLHKITIENKLLLDNQWSKHRAIFTPTDQQATYKPY